MKGKVFLMGWLPAIDLVFWLKSLLGLFLALGALDCTMDESQSSSGFDDLSNNFLHRFYTQHTDKTCKSPSSSLASKITTKEKTQQNLLLFFHLLLHIIFLLMLLLSQIASSSMPPR